MSGHSKWAIIKHKKGAADAKRGKLFAKLSRAIEVAAKEGGGDPDRQPRAAHAIEKARDSSVPKDNIERAIKRGTGRDPRAQAYEAITYEGYGPAASRCSSRRSPTTATAPPRTSGTRSPRTAATSASRARSRGSSSARAWSSSTADGVDEDDLMLAAADAGAEDVELDGETLEVITGTATDLHGGARRRSRRPASRSTPPS